MATWTPSVTDRCITAQLRLLTCHGQRSGAGQSGRCPGQWHSICGQCAQPSGQSLGLKHAVYSSTTPLSALDFPLESTSVAAGPPLKVKHGRNRGDFVTGAQISMCSHLFPPASFLCEMLYAAETHLEIRVLLPSSSSALSPIQPRCGVPRTQKLITGPLC